MALVLDNRFGVLDDESVVLSRGGMGSKPGGTAGVVVVAMVGFVGGGLLLCGDLLVGDLVAALSACCWSDGAGEVGETLVCLVGGMGGPRIAFGGRWVVLLILLAWLVSVVAGCVVVPGCNAIGGSPPFQPWGWLLLLLLVVVVLVLVLFLGGGW